ncbi:hypothetical protein BJX65DRAFT_314458 [Aspergillus insuetus]
MLLAAFLALAIPLAQGLPSSSASNGQGFNWESTSSVLTFGDSYTFVSGTRGYPGYSWMGDALNLDFTAQELLTNKIIQNQTGTSAGAPNWPEYLTGCAVEKGLSSPASCKTQLWDFAFAGATISGKYLPLHHEWTTSLENQVVQYLTYGHPVLVPRRIVSPKKTLVAIWIGINDITDSARNATITSFPAFYNTLISAIFDSVSSLHSAGYKDFLFLNLPPIDLTPSGQNQAPEDRSPNATQIALWNDILQQHAQKFQRRHRDSNSFVYDTNSQLQAVLASPADYGIVNTTNTCPGAKQPDIETNYEAYGCPTSLWTYFWYDSGHITSRVHQLVAEGLEHFLKRA